MPVAVALAAAGCGKRGSDAADDNTKKVTVASTDDATEAIVDEDYRFELKWPGNGWKLLRERDAVNLNPDAIAAAINEQTKTYGIVVVDHYPGAKLDDYAIQAANGIDGEPALHQSPTPIRFAGREARSMMLSTVVRGIRFRYQLIVFKNGNHVFQLTSWGVESRFPADGSAAKSFFDAFTSLPGAIRIRTDPADNPDTAGVGWRMTAGVYESATTRLRVDAGHQFRVVVGAELLAVNGDADLMFEHEEPDVHFQFVFEPNAGDQAAYRRAFYDAQGQGQRRVDGTWSGRFLGTKLDFAVYAAPDLPSEMLAAVAFAGGAAIQVVARYPSGVRERSRDVVEQGLGAVSLMTRAEADTLAAELSTARDRQNMVGYDYSLRGGTYRDFTHGFTWHKPPGFWQIRVGADARKVDDLARIYVEDVSVGLFGFISVEHLLDTSTAAHHKRAVARLVSMQELRPSRPRDLRLGGGSHALISEGPARADGVDVYYWIVSVVRGDTAFIATLWSFSTGSAQDRDRAVALAAGLVLTEAPANRELVSGTYRDRRLGFALRVPSELGAYRDQTPTANQPVGTVITWRHGDRSVSISALCPPDSRQRDRWFMNFLEQEIRSGFGAPTDEPPTTETVKIASLDARHLRWSRPGQLLDAFLVQRDRTFYALMVLDESSGELAKEVLAGFALLD